MCAAGKRAKEARPNGDPAVTPPKVILKKEPEFTTAARNAGVQGTVVFEIILDETGIPRDVSVVSPLGFGLDEAAKATIEGWRFRPAMKDGRPIRFEARVETNFRLEPGNIDEKMERNRTRFNLAIADLNKADPKKRDKAVETIQSLSKQSFPAAMFVEALWMRDGKPVPANPEQSQVLITKAAAKNYGPAMYELGKMYIEGTGVPADFSKRLELIRDASVLVSPAAQFHIGDRYEKGDGVPKDEARAKRSYRLCAATGQSSCQYRLARLLLANPGRSDREEVQAIA